MQRAGQNGDASHFGHQTEHTTGEDTKSSQTAYLPYVTTNYVNMIPPKTIPTLVACRPSMCRHKKMVTRHLTLETQERMTNHRQYQCL